MKTKYYLSLLITTIIGATTILGQKTYVDYKGHIHVEDTIIGRISKGKLNDNFGQRIAFIGKDGQWIDSKGNVFGKPPKNSQLIYKYEMVTDTFDIGSKMHSGMCKITNKKGETILLIHNRYKQEAICAIHCLYVNHCLSNSEK